MLESKNARQEIRKIGVISPQRGEEAAEPLAAAVPRALVKAASGQVGEVAVGVKRVRSAV